MRRTRIRAWPMVVGVLLGVPAGAQPPVDDHTLTITEAIELAWRNNIQAQREQDNLRLAEAQHLGTRATFLPLVTAGGSWSRSSPVQLAFINDQLIELKDFYQFQVRATQPLFDGLDFIYAPRAAAAAARGSSFRLRATRQALALEAKRACYDLIKAQMLADVQRRAVQRSEEQLATAKARYELGSASMSDYLKSKVQLGTDSLELIRRDNNIKVSRATLNDFLGLAVHRPTTIDARLEFEAHPLPGGDAQQAAVGTHPIVRAAQSERDAAGYSVGSARSERLPSISAFANYSYSTAFFPEGLSDIWRDDNASFGVSFSYTLFSGFSTTSRVRQARVRRHIAEEELAQARRGVTLAITTSSLRVEEARKRYFVSEEQVRSAQEDLNIAQEKYNLGAATILDILNAQVSLSQAETGKIEAIFDYNLAVADLEKAMGGGD